MRQQEKLHLIGDIEGSTLFDGTNDVEIETNLTKFKYMEYTTKISANTVSTIKSEDLPEGYKISNCISQFLMLFMNFLVFQSPELLTRQLKSIKV